MIAATAGLMLTGCNKDDGADTAISHFPEDGVIRVTTNVNEAVLTRAGLTSNNLSNFWLKIVTGDGSDADYNYFELNIKGNFDQDAKEDNGKAKVTSIGILPTLIARNAKDFKRQPQDPLGLESSWLTRDGKYINMGLLLKNGRNDNGEEGIHALALALDEVRQNEDQTKTVCYRLLHDQGEAAEYYTNRRYVCILLPTEERPDSVCLTVNTYDGVVVKKFKL
jgi:hypothetical protein